jgi:putative hydrolase of the HAD superfamily
VGIRGVIFDWGGTLTPWHDVDLYAQWYAYSEVYDPENAAALARRLCEGEERRWRRQRDANGAVAAGALDQLFLDEGIEINGARHLRALGSYLDFWAPHTHADPDAKDVLAALKHRGYKVGVLSNTMWTATHHTEVFARDDLDAYIDAAVYTSEIPVAKPHADAFRMILEALDLAAEESVYVGDRLWDDVAGAQQVGMRAIWIPHSTIPEHQVPDDSAVPDAVAHRLLDVFAIVESWQ